MEDINSKIVFMNRYNLTAEELFVVELLLIAIQEDQPQYLVDYYSLPFPKTELRVMLENLQNKQIILKSYKIPAAGTKLDVSTIPLNANFLHNYRKASGELGQELFSTYPNYALIQGVETPLRNYGKKFNTEADFYFQYGRSIGWNTTKHQEVLDLINWSKENGGFGLNMNIGDFVISKMWESIKEYKESGRSALSFDVTQSI